jgi:uncharacterized membrane protein
MRWLVGFIGLVLGATFFGIAKDDLILAGAITGFILGFLVVHGRRLSARVRTLEEKLAQVSKAAPAAAVEPSPAVAVEPVPEKTVSVSTWQAPSAVRVQSAPIDTTPRWTSRPHEPDAVDRAIEWAKDFFTGENAIVRIGMIVLFFGVAFLLKFVADRGMLPVEWRLVGVAAFAVVLLVAGWRLRGKRATYGLILQGGAIGILYLTVFGAFRLYGLLPAPFAFALLVAMVVLGMALAVLQNARSLALLATAGGFLAPVLTSTGGGRHVLLFGYYALLNVGILGVGWYRAWRELNLVGFIFTFAMGFVWGQRYYHGEIFASTEPFLILFFVFYVALAVLFARRQPPHLKGTVDGTLVFGVPVVAFALQAVLMKPYAYGLALSAVAIGIFYLSLATAVFRKNPTNYRLLAESFLALGIVFGTLAIPLALDARWTAAAWAVEGAAIVWVSARQQRWLGRAFGSLLVFAAGVSFIGRFGFKSADLIFLNGHFLGCGLIAGASFFVSFLYAQKRDDQKPWEGVLHYAHFVFGVPWWCAGVAREIDLYVPSLHQHAAALTAFALTALLALTVGIRAGFVTLRRLTLGLAPVLLLFMLASVIFYPHPFEHLNGLAWAVAIVAHVFVLRHATFKTPGALSGLLHACGVWVVAGLFAKELAWAVDRFTGGNGAWGVAAVGVALATVLLSVSRLCQHATRWPWKTESRSYLNLGLTPLALLAALWSVAVNLSDSGRAEPLPYVPLLNPLDLSQIFVFVGLWSWFVAMRASHFALTRHRVVEFSSAIGVLGFLWLNALLLRSLHHFADIAFSWHAMMGSTLVQAALSIFWTVIALPVTVFAARLSSRPFWLVGAGLLALTVGKLFLVDLARTGTVARIVSFLVVGVLLLLIGYLAPMPARVKKDI